MTERRGGKKTQQAELLPAVRPVRRAEGLELALKTPWVEVAKGILLRPAPAGFRSFAFFFGLCAGLADYPQAGELPFVLRRTGQVSTDLNTGGSQDPCGKFIDAGRWGRTTLKRFSV